MKSEEEMAIKMGRNNNELTILSSQARTFFVRITSFERPLERVILALNYQLIRHFFCLQSNMGYCVMSADLSGHSNYFFFH